MSCTIDQRRVNVLSVGSKSLAGISVRLSQCPSVTKKTQKNPRITQKKPKITPFTVLRFSYDLFRICSIKNSTQDLFRSVIKCTFGICCICSTRNVRSSTFLTQRVKSMHDLAHRTLQACRWHVLSHALCSQQWFHTKCESSRCYVLVLTLPLRTSSYTFWFGPRGAGIRRLTGRQEIQGNQY